MRCASCGYSRPSGTDDAPAFHKPGCKVRRALKAAERKSTRRGAQAAASRPEEGRVSALTFEQRRYVWGDESVVAKVEGGRIFAAVLFPDGDGEPQRWLAGEVDDPYRIRQ